MKNRKKVIDEGCEAVFARENQLSNAENKNNSSNSLECLAKMEKKTSVKSNVFGKIEIILLCTITFFSFLISFINLGSFTAPKTYWQTDTSRGVYNDYVSFEVAPREIENVWVYVETPQMQTENFISKLTIYLSNHNDQALPWYEVGSIDAGAKNSSRWVKAELKLEAYTKECRYVKLQVNESGLRIGEVVFTDENNSPIQKELAGARLEADRNDTYKYTIDEQKQFKKAVGSSSMTKGESETIATIKSILNGEKAINLFELPFGYLFLSLGALIFGSSPFGFRFIAALCGFLILPLCFLIARKLLKNTSFAFILAILVMLSGINVVATRYVSVVTPFVLFSLIAIYMMMLFTDKNINRKKDKINYLALILSIAFLSLALSITFLAIPILILCIAMFVIYMIRKGKEYSIIKQINVDSLTEEQTQTREYVVDNFKSTCIFLSVLAGVLVVICTISINLLSYLFVYRGGGFIGMPLVEKLNVFNCMGEHISWLFRSLYVPINKESFSTLFLSWFGNTNAYMAEAMIMNGKTRIVFSIVNPLLNTLALASMIFFVVYFIVCKVRIKKGLLDKETSNVGYKLYLSNKRVVSMLAIPLIIFFATLLIGFVAKPQIFHYLNSIIMMGFVAALLRSIYVLLPRKLFSIKLARGYKINVSVGKLLVGIALLLALINFIMFMPLYFGFYVSADAARGMFGWFYLFCSNSMFKMYAFRLT